MLKKGTDRGLRRWRAVALLATGIAIGVTMTATPAMSHVGGTVSHLWNTHIKPKADARYVNSVAGTNKAPVAVTAEKLNGITIVKSAVVTISPSTENNAIATCPAGTFVVGGGALGSAGSPDPYMNSSWPNSTTSWRVWQYNPTGANASVQAYAVCVAANSSAYPARAANRPNAR
jgi:hypothetical protein